MAFIPTPGAARCFIRGKCFGRPIANSLWFHKGADWTQPELQLLAQGLEDWIDNQLKVVQTANMIWEESRCYAMHDSNGPFANEVFSIAGTKAGVALPGQDCMTVTFQTANRGRSGRGRNYVSGLSTVDRSGNVWEAATISAVQAAYAALIGVINVYVSCSHVVVSHQRNLQPLSQGLPQVVTNYRGNGPIYNQGDRSSG